ncbi:MAG: hypothetical protein JWP25_6074 [Bradyrhizobium sp.]|nr:hypothetical protein [Bradyrhizobium sp.]
MESRLAYVGIGLIFLLSFYPCAVLRDFRSRVVPGDKAWDIAWIGIESIVDRHFLASMLLPLGTALLLFERPCRDNPLAGCAQVWIRGMAVLSGSLYN